MNIQISADKSVLNQWILFNFELTSNFILPNSTTRIINQANVNGKPQQTIIFLRSNLHITHTSKVSKPSFLSAGTRSSTAFLSFTSSVLVNTLMPSAPSSLHCWATLWRASWRRARRMTLHPARAKRTAVAAPIPLEAPVTTALWMH